MRTHLSMVLGLCGVVFGCSKPGSGGAPQGSGSAAPASEVVMVPGVSFGPLRLGAAKAEIDALGLLRTHPHFSGMTVPFTVHYDDAGKATSIKGSLAYSPGDVRIDKLTISKGAKYQAVVEQLGDCTASPPAFGGASWVCRGGAVTVSIGSGSPSEVWVATSVAAAKP